MARSRRRSGCRPGIATTLTPLGNFSPLLGIFLPPLLPPSATPAPDAGSLDLTVFANPSPGIFRPVFSCAGRQCLLSKEKDSQGAAGGAHVGMQCQQSSCTALCDKAEDAFCIDLMIQLLASIGETGTLDLICEADGDSCVMHEAVLDAYFKGIVFDECRLGECAPRNAGNMTLQELR